MTIATNILAAYPLKPAVDTTSFKFPISSDLPHFRSLYPVACIIRCTYFFGLKKIGEAEARATMQARTRTCNSNPFDEIWHLISH